MARFSISRTVRLIVLLTDFGFKDSYVGVMKGVIRGISRDADVIDLSHNIMPQDVAEAAFVLSASYRYFPEGSIFASVVDPGVGTDRAVLCMKADRRLFLAPDNGLLNVIAERVEGAELRKVTADEYFLKDRSVTFHGRDIFAPVAAHLAEGLEPAKLGPVVTSFRKLRLPHPVRTADGSLRGQIVYIDQFGNLITNIGEATLARSFSVPPEKVVVHAGGREIRGLATTYEDREEGELLALIGSSGYLEIAVSRGSAARLVECEKGESVVLTAPAKGR